MGYVEQTEQSYSFGKERDLIMKRPCILVLAVLVVGLLSGVAGADNSYLGSTGSILTPNDVLVGPGELAASFHMLQLQHDVQVVAANIGVTESLELGIARFDPRGAAGGVKTVLSGKYLISEETVVRPSIVVGVIDISGGIAQDDKPSAYIVLGKNLTRFATGMVGEPVQPLKGYVGYGMGIYDGLFVGAELSLSPTASIVGEYASGLRITDAINASSVFSVGARFELTNDIRANAGLINGNDFAFGVSYTGSSF